MVVGTGGSGIVLNRPTSARGMGGVAFTCLNTSTRITVSGRDGNRDPLARKADFAGMISGATVLPFRTISGLTVRGAVLAATGASAFAGRGLPAAPRRRMLAEGPVQREGARPWAG